MLFHRCPDCDSTAVTRRRFLAGTGVAAAAAMLPAPAVRAQAAKTLIDTHCHMYPPQYMKMQHDYEDARKIPAHRILALNRGKRSGVLKLKLEWAAERSRERALNALAEHSLHQWQSGMPQQPIGHLRARRVVGT